MKQIFILDFKNNHGDSIPNVLMNTILEYKAKKNIFQLICGYNSGLYCLRSSAIYTATKPFRATSSDRNFLRVPLE